MKQHHSMKAFIILCLSCVLGIVLLCSCNMVTITPDEPVPAGRLESSAWLVESRITQFFIAYSVQVWQYDFKNNKLDIQWLYPNPPYPTVSRYTGTYNILVERGRIYRYSGSTIQESDRRTYDSIAEISPTRLVIRHIYDPQLAYIVFQNETTIFSAKPLNYRLW